MTLDQYISTAASVGAFLAAFATLLTVWQIAKQRKATYRPDIAVKRARIIADSAKVGGESLEPLMRWRREDEKFEDKKNRFGEDYSLLLVNIGLGAATNISVTWEFPMVSFVMATQMLAVSSGYPERIEFKDGVVSFNNPRISSMWRNQNHDHFDYLVPASIDKTLTELHVPSAYVLAVAARMKIFLRDLQRPDRDVPQVPPLRLVLEFNDIARQKHYLAYDIEFKWHMSTPYTFEAELIPKRV